MATSESPPTPPTLSQAFAQKIKELLEEDGISQLELAKRLGVSQPTVSYLLKPRGRRTERPHPLDFYQRLVQSLGLELSDLLREVEARVRAAGPRRSARLGVMRLGQRLGEADVPGSYVASTTSEPAALSGTSLAAQLLELEAMFGAISQRQQVFGELLEQIRNQLVHQGPHASPAPEASPQKRKRGDRPASPAAGSPA